MARASGFIKEKTDIFYDTLTKIVDVNKLQASDIFNVDETALSTVQRPHVSWRGPARPGKTRSFKISSLEFASRAEAPYSGRLRYYSM
ncbi:hypothetical protein J6590_084409 [Homalodisca vitripennis]|nr:hypothetical protein J6590_084409 [Homalodisca vitripennis]